MDLQGYFSEPSSHVVKRPPKYANIHSNLGKLNMNMIIKERPLAAHSKINNDLMRLLLSWSVWRLRWPGKFKCLSESNQITVFWTKVAKIPIVCKLCPQLCRQDRILVDIPHTFSASLPTNSRIQVCIPNWNAHASAQTLRGRSDSTLSWDKTWSDKCKHVSQSTWKSHCVVGTPSWVLQP